MYLFKLNLFKGLLLPIGVLRHLKTIAKCSEQTFLCSFNFKILIGLDVETVSLVASRFVLASNSSSLFFISLAKGIV